MFPSVGFSNPSAGGTALITGNVILTAASPQAMSITPATPGLYATLPDATTMTKAIGLFSVYNAGDYDYGVKDSAGTQLGWIRARTGAVIGLSDSSTAAGVWAYYGLEKTGITAQYVNPTVANMASNVLRRIALDATRTAFLFGGVDCYVIAYDSSSQTWGAATLVRATVSSGAFTGILQTTNQILVCSCSSTTAFEAVTVTFSGTTPTVNSGTKATATLGGNWASFGQFVSVPAQLAFTLAYGYTTACCIRSFTVSGTTPTIGAEAVLTPSVTTSPVLFVSGSIVRTVSASATNIYAKPYTLTGSTQAAGTQASAGSTAAAYRAFLNGNGNIVAEYANTTHYASIFKLTGTVEAVSSVSLGTAGFAGNPVTDADYVAVTASKTCFLNKTSTTVYVANILTDTTGTATAGTEITCTFTATITIPCGLWASGNNASFIGPEGTAATQHRLTFDCSGSSPVLSSTSQIVGMTGATVAVAQGSDLFGVRNPLLLLIPGTFAYQIATNNSSDLAITNFGMARKTPLSFFVNPGNGPNVVGVNNNESWITYPASTNAIGYSIQRVEAAA